MSLVFQNNGKLQITRLRNIQTARSLLLLSGLCWVGLADDDIVSITWPE